MRAVWVLLGLVGGYVAGAVLGAVLVSGFSGNTHDKGLEMAMTGAFVTGPIGALVGAVVAWVIGARGRRGPPSA